MESKKKLGDFDTLKSLTIVNGLLTNLTPIRVGLGREPPLEASADVAVLRMRIDGRLVPYIPGSSLKGVFRSFIEQLARSTDSNIHEPWDFKAMEEEAKTGKPCVACGIFGSTELASHVRIYDAYPSKDREPLIRLKTGVVIDREFQGARPGLLYTEEIVEPSYDWRFRMDIFNIPFPGTNDERSKYLSELFDTLKKLGLQVGARKSVGMGLMILKEASYKTYVLENGALKVVADGVI